MGWFKTGAGAVIGGLIGGPIGAGIGAAIGSMLGESEDSIKIMCPHCGTDLYIDKNTQNNLFKCSECEKLFIYEPDEGDLIYYSVGIIAKLAKSDGVVSANEAKEIGKILREDFQLEGESLSFAKEVFKELKDSKDNIYDLADILYSIIGEDEEFMTSFYALLFRIAATDGGLEPAEEEILRNILTNFRLNSLLFDEMYEFFLEDFKKIEEAFKVFECDNSMSFDEIKKIYKQKILEFHPDKYNSLPENVKNLIQQEAQKINEAYDVLKKYYQQ